MSLLNLRACTLTRHHVAHEHAYHQLILATSGETELAIEHRGERITQSLGCLIPSTYHHEYQGDGRNRTLVVDIPLSSLQLMNGGDDVERMFARPRFFAVTTQLQQLAKVLMQQVDAMPALRSDIANLILKALYCQLYDRDLGAKRMVVPRHARERLDLARIDDYIDLHLGEEIHVEDLAGLCALSPGHFHICFRDSQGLTPLAYVQRRRLEYARTLVNETDLALGHIAQLVGFRDQGSFSRAYRRQFDVAPSQQRRSRG